MLTLCRMLCSIVSDLRIKILFFNFHDVMKTLSGAKIRAPCRTLATTTVFITNSNIHTLFFNCLKCFS